VNSTSNRSLENRDRHFWFVLAYLALLINEVKKSSESTGFIDFLDELGLFIGENPICRFDCSNEKISPLAFQKILSI
jgi:hypothetical protein